MSWTPLWAIRKTEVIVFEVLFSWPRDRSFCKQLWAPWQLPSPVRIRIHINIQKNTVVVVFSHQIKLQIPSEPSSWIIKGQRWSSICEFVFMCIDELITSKCFLSQSTQNRDNGTDKMYMWKLMFDALFPVSLTRFPCKFPCLYFCAYSGLLRLFSTAVQVTWTK